jgi:3-oxoacyl-[acyl-carrier protein] reductase
MTHYLTDGAAAESFLKNAFHWVVLARLKKLPIPPYSLQAIMGSYITGQVISVCGGLNI